jgi:hypothetical protein
VRYGYLKITRCNENSFSLGKHGNTWNSGNTRDNATWDDSKLNCTGNLSFIEKKMA